MHVAFALQQFSYNVFPFLTLSKVEWMFVDVMLVYGLSYIYFFCWYAYDSVIYMYLISYDNVVYM